MRQTRKKPSIAFHMPAIGGAITSSVLLSIPRGRAARWNGPVHHYLQTAAWSKCLARGVQSKSGNSHWFSLKLLLSPRPGEFFRLRLHSYTAAAVISRGSNPKPTEINDGAPAAVGEEGNEGLKDGIFVAMSG